MAAFNFPSEEELISEARKQVLGYMSVVSSIYTELVNNKSKHNCPEYKKKRV